ncbi:SagB/ThcOx family dehydrogenase [Nitratifractor salsuginis]|uniref:SagB-type dehydrogenase domain protein n=1 Tax=Nitratifractor salsuginis (strain DSM 16511 / JCM 12458 / E9I37-1) TaxID=749222 RepID=E6WZ58_NITSE|nr:SagB/ThcOx family dehydrogenase [Nitratifractor salsuginis]ADV45508.1 SagB-type dehydrogenase domain protein [Nitratifractor salsuginis DSM 16511]
MPEHSFTPFPFADVYHEKTEHSWLSVRKPGHSMDWSTQPSPYKRYSSELLRVSLTEDNPLKRFLYRVAGITAKKSYPGVEYYLRSNPSAGALYPNEVYFQARGVEDFPDGIYHLEVASSSAVLLAEIGQEEGLDAYLEDRHRREGLLLCVSGVYWRSSWKYHDRAFRYVLLDAGHLLGSAEAAAQVEGTDYSIRYRIDREGLNQFFGFGREEWMLSCFDKAAFSEKTVEAPLFALRSVDPTGTFEPNDLIEQGYRETDRLQGCQEQRRVPKAPFDPDVLAEAIYRRRSIRAFTGTPITLEELHRILDWAEAPVPSDCDESLHLYMVVNNVEGMKPGLWLGEKLLREGDLSGRAGYLCLEQTLGCERAVTFFITGEGNYQPLYQKAGLIGQRLYLAAEAQGIGASGIGAYYDQEVQEFLGTKEKVLYAFAVGR